jgi:hypothetical protein
MSDPPSPSLADNEAKLENGHVELQQIEAEVPRLPIEDDIMQLARLGELRAIQDLLDSGKYSISYKDEQGITPLHVSFLNTSTFGLKLNSLIVGCD